MYVPWYSGPAFNIQELKNTGITHIISVTPSIGEVFPQDFTYLHISDAYKSLIAELVTSLQHTTSSTMLGDHGGKVLVHGDYGENRSTTILAAYLMRKEGLVTDDAVHRINRVRTRAYPSKQYWNELKHFEQALEKEGVIRVHGRGHNNIG